MKDPYMIYVETYGKVQSGSVLKRTDYGEISPSGITPYDEKGTLAISLAAQDVKTNTPMRSKSDFEEQIKKLLK